MDDNSDELKKRVEEILRQNNIRIAIGGCGCCGSPWVSFEKDGIMIVKDGENFDIDMFEENK